MIMGITTVVAMLIIWLVFATVYRLEFHALVGFPGPRFAALTHYYRAYYEVFQHGGWLDQLKVLHAKYGPIIRVSPNELHFSTPGAWNEISRFPKDGKWYRQTLSPAPESLTAVWDPQEASKRRARFGPYFSRKAVLELESTIQNNVDKLVNKIASYASSQQPVDLVLAYRATTIDIIKGYLFSQRFNALDYEGFKHPLLIAMDDTLSGNWFLKYLPFSSKFPVARLPDRIVKLVSPAARPALNQKHFLLQKIKEWEADARMGKKPGNFDEQRVIFDVFLNPEWLAKYGDGVSNPKEEGGQDIKPSSPWVIPYTELMDECTGTQFAGTDTVGNACIIGTFHLLNDRRILEKLEKELDEAWKDVEDGVSFEKLEKLPYLTGVVKESLRLSYGVPGPMPRVIDKPETVISGHPVPVGTVVSSSAYFSHMNPSVFPSPERFIPERWISSNARDLEKHLFAFSKGPRMCIGINLAWCELYLIMGNVFRKLEMEIHDTTSKDLEFGDYFVPIFRGKHLRAKVKGLRE
ncbi:hypothetical protein AAF712_006253 [Marasmius tenuissimus]|uniref:Cytochrome P450 n=1 Tax=Marasmius tenuissimus TaxID=585030 RepID=A0ABR2ZZF3_9AGAR